MKACQHVTCTFDVNLPHIHHDFEKIKVIHHRNPDGRHGDKKKIVVHSCGASESWLSEHLLQEKAHRADGKLYDPNDRSAPACVCECEQTSLTSIDQMKKFLSTYNLVPTAGKADRFDEN